MMYKGSSFLVDYMVKEDTFAPKLDNKQVILYKTNDDKSYKNKYMCKHFLHISRVIIIYLLQNTKSFDANMIYAIDYFSFEHKYIEML